MTLRERLHLPKTRIETDSYIAVQLIEQKGVLNFDSLRYMAEQLRGSFTITVLDSAGSLYIVKGDNPFCLYFYPSCGLYVYASTKEILEAALEKAGSPACKRSGLIWLAATSCGSTERGRSASSGLIPPICWTAGMAIPGCTAPISRAGLKRQPPRTRIWQN